MVGTFLRLAMRWSIVIAVVRRNAGVVSMLAMFWKCLVCAMRGACPVVRLNPVECILRGLLGFVEHNLGETFEAVTILDLLLAVCRIVLSDSLLLCPDEMLELLNLCFQRAQIVHILFNLRLWEVLIFMTNAVKAVCVGVCDNVVWDGKISLDLEDLGRADLSE